MALAHVDDTSFWGGPTYVPGRLRSDEDEYPEGYVQLPNNGSMIHESFDRIEASGPIMAIDERLEWLTQSGTHVVDEQCSIQWDFTPAAEGAWILRFGTTITNAFPRPVIFSSPTVLGGPAGYGGLAWRGTRSFTGGDIMTSGARTGPS